MVRGVRIGSESVDVTRTAAGMKISAVGQLAPPFDLVTSRFEMAYGSDGHPQQLTIEGVLRGQVITLGSTFGVTTAVSDIMQGPQRASNTMQISPRTIVLPNNFFAAYEALAARLATTPIGTRLPIFLAPEGEIGASVDAVTPRRIVSPSGATDLKQYRPHVQRARRVRQGAGLGRCERPSGARGPAVRLPRRRPRGPRDRDGA